MKTKLRSISDLQAEIDRLETFYVDAFCNQMDLDLLNSIWQRIKLLKAEIKKLKVT